MKRTILFLLFLAGLAIASGYLMSQMSWIGRLGINLVHKEYKFLKYWWQGAAVVYGVLLLLFVIQSVVHRAAHIAVARIIHFLFLVGAAGGFYLTQQDFSDDFSHHLLKQRFHIGAYLFWVGWACICVFFLFTAGKRKLPKDAGNTAAINE